MRSSLRILSVLLLAITTSFGQDHYARYQQLDVLHYRFDLHLTDQSNRIEGNADIRILFKEPSTQITLDLVKAQPNGKGMQVSAIQTGDQALNFTHTGDQLHIQFPAPVPAGQERSVRIQYAGIPADGLIISSNKFGDRTFFGDNWPNRARHWLPTVDHPSDKASVEFEVTAPEHYQVIANGIQIEETNLEGGEKLSWWKEDQPLPTKVMVIGVARFAVQFAGEVQGVPVTSWVFPDNRKEGFYDYQQATTVLDWFIQNIGPYAYRKLANVQSKTRFGGMENAGNIFYFENSVTGKQEREDLIAHEIAHQWFGNMASEANWHHVWLSEGFATYCTDLYWESRYGWEAFAERIQEEREEVIGFAQTKLAPVVDTTITDYMQLLNTNSYQKGAWVLHMLRQKIGNEAFWKGLRLYYDRFQGKNALTEDLQAVMEEVSKQDLATFFRQWIYYPGFPELSVVWNYDVTNKTAEVEVSQRQGALFQFPLQIGLIDEEGTLITNTVLDISQKKQLFKLSTNAVPAQIQLDPGVQLLFTGRAIKK